MAKIKTAPDGSYMPASQSMEDWWSERGLEPGDYAGLGLGEYPGKGFGLAPIGKPGQRWAPTQEEQDKLNG